MSQHADGGLLASKPYVATGRYVDRQSDYCRRCRFDPAESIGDGACPFTTLYWDFLSRHRERLSGNRRMLFQLRNLERKSAAERRKTSEAAERVRERLRAATL
jgi:deoxyribodipyrimidine photolyase-related protein